MTRVLAVDVGGTKFAAAVIDDRGVVHARAEEPIAGADPVAVLRRVIAATVTGHIAADPARIAADPARIAADPARIAADPARIAADPAHIVAGSAQIAAGAGSAHIVVGSECIVAGADPAHIAVGSECIVAAAIGSAGPLDRARGTVSPVNIPAWRDFPLVATVAEWLPDVPLSLAGDAQCMALGEWWRGDRPGSLLGVVVSTGIGGGLVLDGRPYLGPTGNAGHIGHITVDPRGERCPCGADGCVETFASGPAMVRWARRNGWSGPDARALAAAAKARDPVARQAFERGAEALATGLLTTAALCDVERVVIGGGVAEAGDTLMEPLRRALRARRGMAFLARLRVEPAALGRDAGLYGAAALALRNIG